MSDDTVFSEFGYPIAMPVTCFGNLEGLPDEILDHICMLLAPPSATRRDIASFSCVSKKCAKASSRRRVERITITIGTTAKLRQDVNELDNILGRSDRLGCVRQIKVRDNPPQEKEHRCQLVRRDRQTAEDENSEADDEDDHDICRLPRCRKHTGIQTENIDVFSGHPHVLAASPNEIREMSSRFWPLSGLIVKLPRLTDFIWDCDYHIPLCVLTALKLDCPATRLHVHKFHLRMGCLPGPVIGVVEANADEYALVTSPSLHAIAWEQWSELNLGQMNDALWCMLRGAAPNLKHLVLNWRGSLQHSYRCTETLDFEPTNRKATLETLSVDAVKVPELSHWANTIDFNELRTLRLRGIMDQPGAFALRDIIKEQGVAKLRILELQHDNGIWGEATVAVSNLLLQVPPLEHIDFTGTVHSEQLPAIMEWHGPTLRVLELKVLRNRSMMQLLQGLEEVLDMEHRCARLERLDLTIARTHGDSRELAIYQSLARMPRLRHVKIRLDCSMQTLDPKPGEPRLSEDDPAKLSFGDYRMALMNTAIDHNLVVSIFNLFGPQLEYLRVKPRGQGDLGRRWYDEQAMELLDWVGRDWVIRRDASGQIGISRGGCIREGPNGGGPWRGESLLRSDFGRFAGFDDEGREDLREIWRSIWPGQDGDRAEQWASMALARPDYRSSEYF